MVKNARIVTSLYYLLKYFNKIAYHLTVFRSKVLGNIFKYIKISLKHTNFLNIQTLSIGKNQISSEILLQLTPTNRKLIGSTLFRFVGEYMTNFWGPLNDSNEDNKI